jgi:flagellar protein FlgJ
MSPAPITRVSTHPDPDAHARLRHAAQQLEGVFLLQMLQAMRAAAPAVGLTGAGPGEELFTGLLDEHMAQAAAARSTHGLADALYRQLARRLPPENPTPSPTETP